MYNCNHIVIQINCDDGGIKLFFIIITIIYYYHFSQHLMFPEPTVMVNKNFNYICSFERDPFRIKLIQSTVNDLNLGYKFYHKVSSSLGWCSWESLFSRRHWLTFEKPVQSHYESQTKMMICAQVLKRSACDGPSFKFSSFYVKSRNKSG